MSDSFTLAVTGQSLIKHDTRAIQSPEFDRIKAVVKSADLAFTNFEGTIYGTHGGWPMKGFYYGSAKPAVLDALDEIGFKALSLSNNHAFDLGPPGVLSTLDEVGRRGFLHAGIGRSKSAAREAASTSFDGKSVAMVAMDGGPGPDFMYATDAAGERGERPGVNRIRLSRILELESETFQQLQGILEKAGYSSLNLLMDNQPDDEPPVAADELAIGRAIFRSSDRFKRTVKIDPDDLEANLRAVRIAAEAGDLVIAYLHHHHWSSDWLQSPDWMSAFARQFIDAGAAIFVSHGVPVLLPIEIYRGRPIFHSLGNFIFHTRSEIALWQQREVWESVVARCTFGADNRLTALTLHPLIVGGEEGLRDDRLENRLVPHPATGASAERILKRVKTSSADYGSRIEIADGHGQFDLE
ncbi:CapA family protein [Chelatococcus asaccharovorans]|uniref:Poly-gamma-glutamate synthesis protein (Capsule biosynthesis protein) n=1 Tax=Chelatococcus asaccharovorans TaxID=28210 RepID=A0A2V3U3J9_9HYPH|nr:CapA family protein [Chelatococcus asaccharovorans]MBS7702777.1 CapA family protein [Chelatococcus asaccharovorans]PXW57071.1 poly-gamma-glutamate synthesis protein (capsule biosynthesis protein) [Chelatococcus asaccharovorans]CAH1672759.1 Poly-gamma-glutamate synthesis protein (Capsule biosynthesis protein) [Chelatococcus asaccharovorans]CAH1675842.1 Poly-gamma-glutamate synthesis protein (Capsule biosynthesis protein) [Chelatococcus asaccharovorans]